MNTVSVRFCARCGSSLVDTPMGHLRCARCSETRSSDARVLVACCVMQGQRLLWMRRGIEPRRGFWAIPSGFLESGETLEQGAARELSEETGLKLPEDRLQLHGLGSVPHMNEVYVVFRTSVGDVTLAPGEETLEARFFSESELPWDDIAFPAINYLARLTYADMRRGHHGLYLAEHSREAYVDQQ